MTENLRHLRALQAFDETASNSSLTKAADVLNVTHGAISRQIKLLEQHLGVTLFHRRSNGVELTKAGQRLHQATRDAFATLQTGVQDVKRPPSNLSLTVSLSTSLALKWLVPQLSAFQQMHPDVSLLLDTNDALADFETPGVDVALRFGEPNWTGLYHEQIQQEELIVVAAPSLIGDSALPMHARDIAKLPLLQDAYNEGWESWAAQVGLKSDDIHAQKIQYLDSAVLLEAAIDGQGVALARQLLASRDLQLGRLVRLHPSKVALRRSLYFVCRPGDQDRSPVRTFKKWLMSLAL